MNSTEYPFSSVALMLEAKNSLQQAGSYTAKAEGKKSATRRACDICCDLRDIGMDCHVAGDTITMDS